MNTLAKKLQVRPGKRWLLYDAPENFLQLLEPLPDGTTLHFKPEGRFDGVQLFVKDSAELNKSLKIISKTLQPDTVFWVMYPKKSSGIKSDLEMMRSWDEMEKYGLRGVAAAAIDQTWTALRFRPHDQGSRSDTCNEAIPNNQYAEYIDVATKTVTPPADVAEMLRRHPAAMNIYQSLSYTNRKEYVLWIVTAKQEKTRAVRLAKMTEKLLQGKKNPSEK